MDEKIEQKRRYIIEFWGKEYRKAKELHNHLLMDSYMMDLGNAEFMTEEDIDKEYKKIQKVNK